MILLVEDNPNDGVLTLRVLGRSNNNNAVVVLTMESTSWIFS